MSDFKEAFGFTMQHEDPQLSGVVTTDAGGRTRFGIAQKFHVDLDDSFFDGSAEDALATAEQIYEHDYWVPMHLFEVKSQNIANKLFDMGVNMGIHQAGHLAQRAVNGLLQNALSSGTEQDNMPQVGAQPAPVVAPLSEDGKIGDKTMAAINSVAPLQLHQTLCELCKQFYLHVAANNPAQAVNLHGWLKRAES